jgi:hypothetical protein
MSIKTRVEKLHAGSVGDVSSHILITQGDKVLHEVRRGKNFKKVIRIVVKL